MIDSHFSVINKIYIEASNFIKDTPWEIISKTFYKLCIFWILKFKFGAQDIDEVDKSETWHEQWVIINSKLLYFIVENNEYLLKINDYNKLP